VVGIAGMTNKVVDNKKLAGKKTHIKNWWPPKKIKENIGVRGIKE
jgi:hypothetical protein